MMLMVIAEYNRLTGIQKVVLVAHSPITFTLMAMGMVHVAGTAPGLRYGWAKAALIYAPKDCVRWRYRWYEYWTWL